MGCIFYDQNSPDSNNANLLMLSRWIDKIQRGNINSLELQEINSSLINSGFEVNLSMVVDSIKAFGKLINITNLDGLNKSLDDALNALNTKQNTVTEQGSSTTLLGSEEVSQTNNDGKETNITEEEKEVISIESKLREELENSTKFVDYSSEIKSSRDLVKAFRGNTALLSRFNSRFKSDLYQSSCVNYKTGKVVRNVSELNSNIAKYKKSQVEDILKYLSEFDGDAVSLLERLIFDNLTEPEVSLITLEAVNKLKNHYSEENPTTKLNSLNNTIYTSLSVPSQKFLNAYYALITLENFDNLIEIISNNLVIVDPIYKNAVNVPEGIFKYKPFHKNHIRNSWVDSSNRSIEADTATITKTIIENIPKLDLDGNWDRYSYLTVADFNSAISRINSAYIKSKYPELTSSHLSPHRAYKLFFASLFENEYQSFKSNKNFNDSHKRILKSIYEFIFNPRQSIVNRIGHNSLYTICKNTSDLDFNYFDDIVAYINKQAPSNYISYKYNTTTQQYETVSFEDSEFDNLLLNYEFTVADILNSKANSFIWGNIKKAKGITALPSRIELTLNGKVFKLRLNNIDTFASKLEIPSPQQIVERHNGKTLDGSLEIGYEILELLQQLTDIPFISYSGQLYEMLLNDAISENKLKSDLVKLLIKAIRSVDVISNVQESGIKPSDGRYIYQIKEGLGITVNDKTFKKLFITPDSNPRLSLNRNLYADGSVSRLGIFNSIVSKLQILNGNTSISNLSTSDGAKVPVSGLMNLVKTIHDFIALSKRISDKKISSSSTLINLMEGNLFYDNPSALLGVELKSEFVTPSGKVVPKTDFNIAEYGVSSMVLDFYQKLMSNEFNHISILPTVYADKALQSLVKVSKDLLVNGVKLSNASDSDLRAEWEQQNKRFYTGLLNNLLNVYSEIIPDIPVSMDRVTNKEIPSIINKINTALASNYGEILTKVNSLQSINPNFQWIKEVHYSNVDGKMQMNPYITNMINIHVLNKGKTNFIKHAMNRFIEDLRIHKVAINSDVFPFLSKIPELDRWINKMGVLSLSKEVNGKVEYNPLIKKFFWADALFSQQFMQITAGEPYAHPSKLKGKITSSYLTSDHAARLIAQYKRMVMMQGTIHNYTQGLFNGTADQVNVAVIEDLKAPVFNVIGQSKNVDALDGSMFITPWQNILENNSLVSSTAGTIRKNFGYDIDPITGTPTLLKTASFTFTNYRTRNSDRDYKLLKNMTDRHWVIPNLNLFERNNLEYFTKGEPLYYQDETGKMFKLLDMVYKGGSIYVRTFVQVDSKGIEIGTVDSDEVLIDSNFKLWEALGGRNSLHLNTTNPNIPFLEVSERSNEVVANFINGVYFERTSTELNRLRTLPGNEFITFNHGINNIPDAKLPKSLSDTDLNQSNYFQPLKYSDVSYLVNTSAIKVGARNINKSNHDLDFPLASFKMGTQYIGIQMDPGHQADNSEVTESTQVISALAANGFTKELANKAYKVIGQLVEDTLEDYSGAIEKLNFGDKTSLYKMMTNALISALSGPGLDPVTQNYLNNVQQELISTLNAGFKAANIDYKIPFSVGGINNRFITMLASRLNTDSIKRTFSGMGGILAPSYGSIQLYRFNNSILSTGDVLNGSYTRWDLVKLAGSLGYNGIEDLISNITPQYIEASEITFGDTIIVNATYDEFGQIIPGTGIKVTIDSISKYNKYKNADAEYLRDFSTPTDLQPSNIYITTNEGKFSIYDIKEVQELFRLREHGASKLELRAAQAKVQKLILDLVEKQKRGEVIIESTPAEIILSKMYKTKFMLNNNDNVSEILKLGGAFFQSRIVNRYEIANSNLKVNPNVNMVLMDSNGQNINVLFESPSTVEFTDTSRFREIPIPTIEEDGIIYKLNFDGSKGHLIEGLKFYVDLKSPTNQCYITVAPDSGIESLNSLITHENYFGVHYNSNRVNGFNYLEEYIKRYDPETHFKSNGLLNYLDYLNAKIEATANEMFTSFEESLNVTANRIPAQGFQSIMSMVVKGFSDSDENEAYVSVSQFFLQGSDLDIDKAFITSPYIDNNGKYVGWSPLFDLSSKERLELSKKLSYPNYNLKVSYSISNLVQNSNEVIPIDTILATNGNDYLRSVIEILNIIEENEYTNPILTLNSHDAAGDIITNMINLHNTKPKNKRLRSNGTKNYLFSLIYNITNDPRNYISASSPVDMDEPQNAAAKSVKGKRVMGATNLCPSTKWELFYANAAGKEAIGISAVGQKVFLAVSQYFNMEAKRLLAEKGNNLTVEDLENSNVFFKNVFEIYTSLNPDNNKSKKNNVKIYCNTLSNINPGVFETPIFKRVLKAALNKEIDKKGIYTSLTEFEPETALVISALISAATD